MPTPQSLPPWMLELIGLRPGDSDMIPVHLHLFRVHLPNYHGKDKVCGQHSRDLNNGVLVHMFQWSLIISFNRCFESPIQPLFKLLTYLCWINVRAVLCLIFNWSGINQSLVSLDLVFLLTQSNLIYPLCNIASPYFKWWSPTVTLTYRHPINTPPSIRVTLSWNHWDSNSDHPTTAN